MSRCGGDWDADDDDDDDDEDDGICSGCRREADLQGSDGVCVRMQQGTRSYNNAHKCVVRNGIKGWRIWRA
jgi:hypothetical protein